MKKIVLMLAVVALLATPAMADMVKTIHATNGVPLNQVGTPRGTPIYADLNTVAKYLNAGTAAQYPLPVADDIHAISGGTITSFTFGYYTPDAGTKSLLVNFFADNPADTVIPPWPAGTPAPIASYMLTGLTGGGAYAFTITGVNVPVGPDFWFEGDYSGSYGLGGGSADFGPLITGNSGGTVGYSHSIFAQTGSTWTLTSGTWVDFYLSFDIVPEPATIGLLVLGGLMILRRR